MKVIAISGYAGSGKSIFGRYLSKILASHNYSVTTMAFGDKPKQLMVEISGESYEQLFSSKNINKNRVNLVAFSEGMKELFGKDVWVKPLIQLLKLCKSDFVIIDDLRFKAEYEWLFSSFSDNLKMAHIRREEVVPKANADWYKTGKEKGLLVGDQLYQYFNLVNPNYFADPMNHNGSTIRIHNDSTIDSLNDLAFQFLKKIGVEFNINEHV